MQARPIARILAGQPATDGAGVRINRLFGPNQPLDPFLMLDEFRSDEASDYIAGFPPHPHRGFETVTYMIEGKMLHEDHLGNRGQLESGGVQWMTAARGIVHSEMPQQEEGLMHGFQLWLNLPASEKMKAASYRDLDPSEIPLVELSFGTARVVAGEVTLEAQTITGPVQGVTTDPLLVDLNIKPNAEVVLPVTDERTTLVYTIQGDATVGDRQLPHRQLAVLGEGEQVTIAAGEEGARLLLVAARPLREPIVAYGPFVMNSVEEIEQALRDYRDGRFTA